MRELSWMENYGSKAGSFLVLYGRRRVGKTELIKEFCKDKKHLYFLATKKTEKDNMEDLRSQMADFLDDELFQNIGFKRWEDLFRGFIDKTEGHVIIAMDEFPYLIEENKAIPSIFQKIWDEILKEEDVTLIICGSSIGMMETHVLGYKSPLYGRRTGQWRLTPFKFKEFKEVFPNHTLEERLEFYSFLDGIPMYLALMDPERDPIWNLKNNLLSKGSYLYEEAEQLVTQELRKPSNYLSILQAIAEGNTKYGEICNRTGFSKSKVSQYLSNLQELHLVKKEFPVTQKKESRNALYRLHDNYYDFWFEFVYPNMSMLEEGRIEEVIDQEKMKKHVSFVFEQICREYLIGEFPKIGRWWGRGEEIDIVGVNKDSTIFGECKYSKNPVGMELLDLLKQKSEHVDCKKKKFVLFSWSGFKDELKEEDVRLVGKKELEDHYG